MNLNELQLRGIQASQQGLHDEAVRLLEQAVALAPEDAASHANLALALVRGGRTKQGIQSYQMALRLRPAHAPTLAKLGRALAAEGDLPAALTAFRRALELQPDDADTWNALGAACANDGKLKEACGYLEQALQLRPSHPEARFNLRAAYEQLCHTAIKQGCWDEASLLYARLSILDPTDAELLYNRGCALLQLERWDEAADSFQSALLWNPSHTRSLNNLGHIQAMKGNLDSAIPWFERALAIDPSYSQAKYNLAHSHQRAGRLDTALVLYRELIAAGAAHADCHNNLGSLLLSLAQPKEALHEFESALTLQPDHYEAAWNRALAQLSLGDFENGWRNYEIRLQRSNRIVHHDELPPWRGEDLGGRRILVWAEQGLGDTVQFARYLPLVKNLGAWVAFEVQDRLQPVYQSCSAIDALLLRPETPPTVDYQVALMSLPNRFATRSESIPPPLAPIVDPHRRNAWRQRLGSTAQPRVGLCWAANPTSPSGALRSIGLKTLLALTAVPGISYLSLQRPLMPADTQLLSEHGIACPEQDQHSLADTVAIIDNLDLVVTVDTLIAHLAASLGKPTWILLPFAADWRWTYHGEHTRWYPSARLFRQPEAGAWQHVINRVMGELDQWRQRSS